jgi:hypothetical protein
MMSSKEIPTQEEILAFQQFYNLPLEGPCPVVPLAGLLNVGGEEGKGGNHYCCTVWRPAEKDVHVLGRHYTSTGVNLNAHNWEEWGGPIIWRNLTLLHGWGHIHLTVKTLDWEQNGYDCGPIACQVLESIWTQGFELTSRDVWKKPRLPCCHPICIQIISDVHLLVMQTYRGLPRDALSDGMVEDAVIQNLDHHPNRSLNKTLVHLERAMKQCLSCIQHSTHHASLTDQCKPNMASVPSCEIRQARGIAGSISEQEVIDAIHSSSDSDDHSPPNILPAIANKDFHVTDWSQAWLGRVPWHLGPQMPALASLRGL